MSEPIVRADPATIPTTLKEAVVDAILNLTHSHVSGAGETGRYLFGGTPRMLLNSGFLLPQRDASGSGDEVTSPIWVSSHGIQLQIVRGAMGTIEVTPRAAIYVRVLPTEDDLKRPNCRARFSLRGAVRTEVRDEIRKRQEEAWKELEPTFKKRYKCPDWKRISKEIQQAVYAEKGLPVTLGSLTEQLAVVTEDGEMIEGGGGDGDGEGVGTEAVKHVVINDAQFEPMAVPLKWYRLDMELPPLAIDPSSEAASIQAIADAHAAQMSQAIKDRLSAWAQDENPKTGGKVWGYRMGLMIPASLYAMWDEFLKQARLQSNIALPDIKLEWSVQVGVDWLDPTKASVMIALENASAMPKRSKDETEESVFLVKLTTELPTDLHSPLRLARVEPSYRYNRYLNYPAMGHNGGVVKLGSVASRVVLATTWTPRFVQPRIVPSGSGAIVRHARTLSESTDLNNLTPLIGEMEAWLEEVKTRIDPGDGLLASETQAKDREVKKFFADQERWRNELTSIQVGIKILEESRQAWSGRGQQKDARGCVFEAWVGMNESMANFMKVRFGHDDGVWRLFQLGFIIANLPALASRMPEFAMHYDEGRDDAVTLLYFATGGGKSEAFFGLLVFNLLLDRLRGKHVGVTAMLRYPLRLLTIQQAQRCAKVLAQADLVRRARGYGGSPLSIGFWVGSSGSPNRHSDRGVAAIPTINETSAAAAYETKLCDEDGAYGVARKAWRKIVSCPYCGSETALRRFPDAGGTIGHVCTDVACASNGGSYRPLPFYICDEDIYDLSPSVLLGTVDKLALIGHSPTTIRRIYGMFGAAPWRRVATGRLVAPTMKQVAAGPDAAGCEPLAPAYPGGVPLFSDPFPSLIIQDEAHLLDESLGTFAGLFESSLDAIFAYIDSALQTIVAREPGGKRRRAKVIAASATVSEPERQLEHLYQRSVPAAQFPHPGPTLYESFYACPDEPDSKEEQRRMLDEPEQRARQARIYCAFMTNGKPHTATSVAILSSFHRVISELFEILQSGDQIRNDDLKRRMADVLTDGVLRELHVQAIEQASASHLLTLVDLHRIALTYVTNKKGGDQIMAAEMEETRKRHLYDGIELEGFDTRLITGSVDQGEIQEVVRRAQDRVKPDEAIPGLNGALRSVIATSAISHGVDVDELNSMWFAGMPSDIAEYIQASSRVGRMHVGFVVLIPTPQRRRDRYIVEVFDIFHRFLERMVMPAAIDRWAEKAVRRVIPSLIQAYLVGVLPSRDLIAAAEADKAKVKDFTYIPNIKHEYQTRQVAFINEVTGFIELAIGLKAGYCPQGEVHYRKLIEEEVRRYFMDWSTAMKGNGPLADYFRTMTDAMRRPMTSLRDVDESGVIAMSRRDSANRRMKPEDVVKVMGMVRHGVAQNDGGNDNDSSGA
jgi:hypothetical protein